jgi:Mg-chelatase subunit ChlD/DNA-binding beta-propeller fold protein YncE
MRPIPSPTPPRAAYLAALSLLLLTLLPSLAPTTTPTAQAQTGARAWARTAVWQPGFNPDSLLDPRGVEAAPGGLFYVADRGHDRIVVVDQNGDIQRSFGSRGDGPRELREPRDVAIDAARDRVYVVDGGNRRIAVFQMDGTPVDQWRSAGPEFGFVPYAVAVSPASGQVYVLSRLPWGFIDRFDADGEWLSGWGDIGTGQGEFQFPEDLAVQPDGRVVVADTNNDRLQIFNALGTAVEAALPMRGVAAVSVEAGTGRIFALHRSSVMRLRPDQISILSSQGALIGQIDSAAPEAFEPGSGIAVGADRVAVSIGSGAADGLHALRQYDAASGASLATTASSPLDFAAFLRPVALDVGPSGQVHVIDSAVNLTRRYAPDGSYAGRLDAGEGDDISVAADGSVYLASAPILGDVRLRRLNPDGSRAWDKSCECLSGLGLAASGDRILAADAYRKQLVGFDLSRGNPSPVISYTVAGAGYAWLVDVDTGPTGLVYGAGGAGVNAKVYVFDPSDRNARSPLRSWDLTDADKGPERIAVSPEGEVYVLRFDGQIEVFDTNGQHLGLIAPEPASGATYVLPRDIAAAAGGRLYVLDAASDSILVYDPAGAVVTPTATREPAPPCQVSGNKTAAPDLVRLGEAVSVQLSLDIDCQPGSEQRADIVLILDRSNSMAGNRPGEKLYEARAAARRFVQQLDLSRHRVAVISFSDIVSLDQGLTADSAALVAALDKIRADGRTDIGAALERALQHLGAAGRPDALPVVLLMTDGNPSRTGQPYVEAVRQGARARGRGALTFAIGLGDDVDAKLLTAIVGRPERYFFAPTAEELDPIYQQLSSSVGEVVATDLTLTDIMGPDVRYQPGSARPAPASETADTLIWSASTIPADGLRFNLQVMPQRIGLLPTNTRALAEYTADGRRFSFEFPIPEVLVVDAPTPTPTATATPPSRPGTIFLPFLAKELCLPKDRERGVDVMLVIDTSSSMSGPKLNAAISSARIFLALVDARRDRVGLASFDSSARLDYVITQDMNAVSRQLGQLGAGVGTRIDLGLEVALNEIRLRGRDRTPKLIVLLSDGRPQSGSEGSALALAQLARERSVTVFAIGLGDDLDADFMRQLARSPAEYRPAADESALRGIYESIAGSLPCR